MINHEYIAEIGGRSKTFKQISDLPNAFLIKDDITIGSKNVLPLWIFGMMY